MNRPAPTRTAACTFPRTTYQTLRCRPSNCGWSAGKHHARHAGSQETRQPASLLRLRRRQFFDVLALRVAGAAEKFTKATTTHHHGRTALLTFYVGHDGRRLFDDCDLTRGVT